MIYTALTAAKINTNMIVTKQTTYSNLHRHNDTVFGLPARGMHLIHI